MSKRFPRAAYLPIAIGLVAAAAFGLGGTAKAVTMPQLSVTLVGEHGGTAVWDSNDNPVLDNNFSGAGAGYVDVNGVSGSTAPSTAPAFTASNDSAGAVRWVIEFHNGQYLFGYGSGASATPTTWVCNPGGSATDYATALKACQPGYDDWVTAAFIVYDTSANLGPVTLTNITYNGAQVEDVTTGPGYVKNANSGKCLDVLNGVYTGGVLQQFKCGASWQGVAGANQQFQLTTRSDGSGYMRAIHGTSNFYVTYSVKGAQLTLSTALSADNNVVFSGGYYKNPATGLVMDVRAYSKANNAQVHGWTVNTVPPALTTLNQIWSAA